MNHNVLVITTHDLGRHLLEVYDLEADLWEQDNCALLGLEIDPRRG